MQLEKFMTGGELNGLLSGKANIVAYSDLTRYKCIEDLLGKNGRVVLLYEVQPSVGHWTTIFYGPPQEECDLEFPRIYFFDSYGLKPDDELEWVDIEFRQKAWNDMRILSRLLKNTPSEIDYNNYRLQKMQKNVNTCGKWCAARLMLQHLDSEAFAELFQEEEDGVSPDHLVDFFINSIRDKGQSSNII